MTGHAFREDGRIGIGAIFDEENGSFRPSLAQLAILDANRATDYQLERIEVLIASDDAAAAKRETLALLEEKPHFWKAQELLLKIVEGGGEPSPPPKPAAANSAPGGLRKALQDAKARAAAPAAGGAQP